MEEYNKKYNSKALVGTLVFHGVLLLLFLFFGLSTPLPLPEEEGVMVNLGFTDQGRGDRQPLTASPPPPQPQATESSPQPEQVATQSTEESVALPPATRPARQQPTQQQTRPQPEPKPAETAQPVQPQPEPQPQVDSRALFPGRDRRTTETQSQGQGGATGNQGRPDGSPDGRGTTGGGQGSGVEFSLTGRRANYLPIPEYNSQAQGRVVVSITVNREGQITRATAGARGTTTSDQALWRQAEEAARRARFDVKSDAPAEQTGTITYNFIRLN